MTGVIIIAIFDVKYIPSYPVQSVILISGYGQVSKVVLFFSTFHVRDEPSCCVQCVKWNSFFANKDIDTPISLIV